MIAPEDNQIDLTGLWINSSWNFTPIQQQLLAKLKRKFDTWGARWGHSWQEFWLEFPERRDLFCSREIWVAGNLEPYNDGAFSATTTAEGAEIVKLGHRIDLWIKGGGTVVTIAEWVRWLSETRFSNLIAPWIIFDDKYSVATRLSNLCKEERNVW